MKNTLRRQTFKTYMNMQVDLLTRYIKPQGLDLAGN